MSSLGALSSCDAQNKQLHAALTGIAHGLVVFDASEQVVLFNARFVELAGLPSDFARPGRTLREVLEARKTLGRFSDDIEEYRRDLLTEIKAGRTKTVVIDTSDGHSYRVTSVPTADGGWVATHEDITEERRREESFRLLFESSPVPMWVFDRASLRFLAVNEATALRYGFSREQFMMMRVSDLRPPEDRDEFVRHLRSLPEVQPTENFGQHRKADGTDIHVAILSRTLTYAGHQARLAVIYDITKAKLAEHELDRTRKFLDAIVEHMPLPIIVKEVRPSAQNEADCRFSLANRAYEELTGESRAEMIGRSPYELYDKERADIVVGSDHEALRSGEALLTLEHPILTMAKGTRLVTAKKTAIRDENGKPQYLLSVLDDVTERRQIEQRIAHLAHHDILTNLPNRAAFNERIAETLHSVADNGGHFTILSVDLDRFKEANDLYGHAVGDALLLQVANRLQATSGESFIARIGGDEFMLIVTDGAQPSSAEALAERLLSAFVDDFEIGGNRIRLGLSIGAAVYPVDGTEAGTLMVNADAALYQAKSNARGSAIFFEEEMSTRLRERRAMQDDLKSALERGDIFLHYQPQKKISGETIGFEALVRWQCPKRGLVAPGTFIPMAEESRLIVPVGEWILREACREAASWPRPLTISVNISPVQFQYGDLPRLVHSILLETGLAPTRLELEITEGVLIADFSRGVSILNRLKALGVQIAMDDFGTGYSSLSYLHSFPFDKIKIDRSFVGDLEYSRHSMAIVRAVVGLGHSLNIPILAEGVETERQHAFLAQAGCDEIQGYLTGRPQLIEHYAELLGRRAVSQSRRTAAEH
jgi:diguanylate cyclase (GGDEF)-like protein/PAS domain S-box-containing protein